MELKFKPDFIIVGAPKCGTTALNFYLSQHPEINMAEKELHFWGTDLYNKTPRPTPSQYTQNWKSDGLNGESSVWYLYSDTFINELKEANCAPKLIILLRNPTDMVYSLHNQNIVDANETEYEFEKALQLESQRKQGKSVPTGADPVKSLFYSEAGDFFPRVKALQEAFGKENVFIGLQEDLLSHTSSVLQKIENFLNVSNFSGYDFSKQNENQVVKNKRLNYLIKNAGKSQIKLFRTLIPFKSVRKKLVDKLYFSNFEKQKRTPLNAKTKESLKRQFEPSLLELSKILDSDITHWF